MRPNHLHNKLRFYFITDDAAPVLSALAQARISIAAGATTVQYRNKSSSLTDFAEASEIRELCKANQVLFIVNDDILLAKALCADGVHLGQEDSDLHLAKQILGPAAIVGASVSTLEEFRKTDLSDCDYIGAGPVFPTGTKTDAKDVIGLAGLKRIIDLSKLPVVAIGGINDENIADCLAHGAAGVSMISAISRADEPERNAAEIAKACGCSPRVLAVPWQDEFKLIDKILSVYRRVENFDAIIKAPAGDDAALLASIKHPVITTDTQKENIHFRLDWQTLEEVGRKAVKITFSDLAASYARPLALFVNLSIPAHLSEEMIESLYKGISNALNRHGAALGGGNISGGKEFSIDLFAIGEGNPDIFPLRSAATPGDGLYVTGPIGLAAAGLSCLITHETDFPELIQKFKEPMARFDAAGILADYDVRCVMDISDGLAGDAGHIAAASKVSIEFDPNVFKVDPVLVAYCQKYNLDPHLVMLSGGEDYELLFACRTEVFEKIRSHLPEAFCVGQLLPYDGRPFTNLPQDIRSYQHGAERK
jgi:thiamine-monophosphate kinase